MLARELLNRRTHERCLPGDGTAGLVGAPAGNGLDTYGPEVAAGALVAEAMATRVSVCGPDADLAEVAEIMLAHDVREVLVFDNGDVLGVVTDRDLLRTMLTLDAPRRPVHTIRTVDDLWPHQPLVPVTSTTSP